MARLILNYSDLFNSYCCSLAFVFSLESILLTSKACKIRKPHLK